MMFVSLPHCSPRSFAQLYVKCLSYRLATFLVDIGYSNQNPTVGKICLDILDINYHGAHEPL